MEPRNINDLKLEPKIGPATYGFIFKGQEMEYFKIWIVNVLLSIITLGLYSPWAKVRNNRYLYSNLYLNDTSFRYLADPLKIFYARIIAIVSVTAFVILGQINPLFFLAGYLTVLPLIPWLINRSIAFERRMTSYKNIEFSFHASYWQAFTVFFVWPTIGALTLGILYPMALQRMNRYLVENTAYGTTRFKFLATYSDYATIIFGCIGILVASFLAILVFGIVLPAGINLFIAPILWIITLSIAYFYFTVSTFNVFFNNTELNDISFPATLTMRDYATVVLTNGLLTLITFGLFFPAAKIRIIRYLSESITLYTTQSLDQFTAAEKENVSALGDEFVSALDISI